MSETLRISLWI